jgi:hypothetical protein
VRFQLGGLHGQVTQALLRLYGLSRSRAGFEIAGIASPGSADVIDERATTAAALPGAVAAVAESGPVQPDAWVTVDVTAAVRGDGPVAFALLAPGRQAVRLASRERGAATAPRLVVRTGPRPAAATPPAGLPAAREVPRARPTTWSSRDPMIGAAGDIACDPAADSPAAGGPNSPPAAGRTRSPARTAAGASAGDDGPPGRAGCKQAVTAELLRRGHVAAVLALGDVQYEQGTLAQFMASYQRSWGRLKSITHPAVGNHEYGANKRHDAAGYFHYFGAAAGRRGQGWYSFDLGTWHLIALNAQCRWIGGCEVGSPEERWLKADLAAHRNGCTLAFWHQPRWSSGQHGNEAPYDAFWRDLYAAGADVVLNGHDHDYERFAPLDPNGRVAPARGIREFVVGTGGKNHYRFTFPDGIPGSEVRNASTFGVLELTLHPGGYDWRFVPEPGKRFADTGTGFCH